MRITIAFDTLQEMYRYINHAALAETEAETETKAEPAPAKAKAEPAPAKAKAEPAPAKAKAEPAKAKTETEPAKAKTETEPAKTKEDVREAFAALMMAGKRDEVKSILKAHGAANVSALAESDYSAVISEAANA